MHETPPDEMVPVDEETGEPTTDPDPEKSDVDPDFVDKHTKKPARKRTTTRKK